MKRKGIFKIAVIFLIMIFAALLVCCNVNREDDGKIRIVTTVFPIYDWVSEITKGSENVEITYLTGPGKDIHSYQPTVDDVVKISGCDILIYVGGESDKWVAEALVSGRNKKTVTVDLMSVLGDRAQAEEVKEGMEEDPEEDAGSDEHVWLSLKNAELFCDRIAAVISQKDPENSEIYEKNRSSYAEKLEALDREYEEIVENAKVKTLIFADRFPFIYLTRDYGLDYFAAFTGCSAESEASFKTILFLAEKTDELGIDTILKIETSDGRVAESVRSNTSSKDQKILTMDSMQSAPSDDKAGEYSYINVMRSNLKVLKTALKTGGN